MKISHLQEGSEAGMPSPSQPAPKFGRSDVAIEETTVAGNVGGGAPSNMGMQRRGQGSMFQGIKTSKKFVNSPVTEDDISEEHISAKQRREEFFNKSQSRDIGNRPQNKDILPKQANESDPEYNDEAGMIKTNLHTSLRAIKGLHKTIGDSENCPEWVQEKIAVASDYLVTCWDYMISQHEQGRKYEMNEGYYSNQDNNRTIFRKPRPDVTEGQWKDIDGTSAPPKGSKLQIKTIEPGSAIRVDPKYKEPVAPKDNGMGRIVQGTWQADPKGTVKAPSGDPEGVKEVAPPGQQAIQQPDGSTRISKPGTVSRADYAKNMAAYKAQTQTPEKIADFKQRMASGQGYTDTERQANLQQQQQHFGKFADTGDLDEQGVAEGSSSDLEQLIQQYEDMVENVYGMVPGPRQRQAIADRDALEARIEALPGGKSALEKWARAYNDSFDEGVAEGFFGIDDKIKGKIQNIVSDLSDIPGMWDHKAQTFTDAGMDKLKTVLKNNPKYIKYALNLDYRDYEAEGVAEAGNGRNRNYSHGFASPNAPSLGGPRHREDDEGWDREEREQRQNWYIRIDGKLLKDKQQQPYTFSGKQAAEKAARTMMAKDFNKDKKFTLTTSWMDAPEQGVKEESKGLWANIHAKRERIKHGSGEKMRNPGSKGAPTADALRKSAK